MRLLGDEIHPRRNLRLALTRHRWWWAALVATAAMDFASTLSFMHAGGVHLEQNLLVRFLAETLGLVPGVLRGKLLQRVAALGFAALSFRLSRAVLLLLILLNLWAVLVNLL